MKLKALLDTISMKEGVEGKKLAAMKNLKEKKVTIDKMNSGKLTWNTFMKSTTGKASETQRLLASI